MEFYFNIGGKQRGPLNAGEFRELVKNKTVLLADHVWDARQGRWVKISEHPELNRVWGEETTLAEAEGDGFFINVEGKTGGPFPRDAIIKEIERGRFKGTHFVWDAVANRWLNAAEHPLFSQFFAGGAKSGARKYYLSKDGAQFGPLEFAEVEEKIAAGEFDRNHFVWEHRLKKWVKVGELADFAGVFTDIEGREPVVPPPIAAAPPPPAKTLHPAAAPSFAAPSPVPAPPASAAPAPLLSVPVGLRTAGGPLLGGPGLGAPPGAPPVVSPFGPAFGPSAPAVSATGAPPRAAGVLDGRAEPKVGDLVTISLPEPAPAPVAPRVTVEQVEFKRVTIDDGAGRGAGPGVKVDRSVILDFSRPSLLRRISAQTVDLVFLGVSYFVIALVFSFLDMNPFMPGPDQYYFQQLFWATLGGVAVFYFLVRDAGGASFGKRIMGLRVVKYDDFNRAANLFHSIARNLTLLLPLVNILEAIYVFSDTKGRRMGDRLAGTVLTEAIEIDYVRQHQGILDEIY